MGQASSRTLAIIAVLTLYGPNLHSSIGDSNRVQEAASSPFVITVVPSWSKPSGPWCSTSCRGVSMATNTLDSFYVILTNVSRETQAVFEPSHSWGYYAVSFEIQAGDGRVVAIKKKQTGFTRNGPSTFLIPPGDQMVYPIKLNDEWVAGAGLPTSDKESFAVRLKAIYEIQPTPESTQLNVWTGRIESTEQQFEFRHWVN